MNIPREVTVRVRNILDSWVPSVIRDTYWFMYPVTRFVFGRHAQTFLNFRKRAFALTDAEYTKTYATVMPLFTRDTDMTAGTVSAIESTVLGKTILEVGCGNGYLAKRLSKKYPVTGVDIALSSSLQSMKNLRFQMADVSKLPFPDRSFDTVVCAHTLEHVVDIITVIQELRRVSKKRLIIVVPMQKPYLYTPDLHIHFFPYPFSLVALMKHGQPKTYVCREIDGDLYYSENYP